LIQSSNSRLFRHQPQIRDAKKRAEISNGSKARRLLKQLTKLNCTVKNNNKRAELENKNQGKYGKQQPPFCRAK